MNKTKIISIVAASAVASIALAATNIVLYQGWNLITPKINGDINVTELNKTSAIGKIYDYNGSGYGVPTKLSPGKGYWVGSDLNTTITANEMTINGSSYDPTIIMANPVANQWRLVGAPVDTNKTLYRALGASSVWAFDAYQQSFSIAETIKAGEGFWVKFSPISVFLAPPPGGMGMNIPVSNSNTSLTTPYGGGINGSDATAASPALAPYIPSSSTVNTGGGTTPTYTLPPFRPTFGFMDANDSGVSLRIGNMGTVNGNLSYVLTEESSFSSAMPSMEQIFAGQNASSQAAARSGQIELNASGVTEINSSAIFLAITKPMSFTGLKASTFYKLSAVEINSTSTYPSQMSMVFRTSAAGTVGPKIDYNISVYPRLSADKTSAGTRLVFDKNVNLHYVVKPTNSYISNLSDINMSVNITANTATDVNVSGLDPNQSYFFFLMPVDDSNNTVPNVFMNYMLGTYTPPTPGGGSPNQSFNLPYSIGGKITVPADVNLTVPTYGTDMTNQNASHLFVGAMNADTGVWLGSSAVATDGTYKIGLNSKANYILQLSGNLKSENVNYFMDFGADHNASNDITSLLTEANNTTTIDKLKSGMDAIWDAQGKPTGVSYLTLDGNATVNVDMTQLDNGTTIIEGNITAPVGFVSGSVANNGWNSLTVQVFDINNSKNYWAEASRTANGDGSYPFKIRLGNASSYIVKINKDASSAVSNSHDEYYYNFGSDHAVGGGDDSLISGNGVFFNCSSNFCAPDTTKTSYIGLTTGQKAGVSVNLQDFASNSYEVNGTFTMPTGTKLNEYWSGDANASFLSVSLMRITANGQEWLPGAPVKSDGSYRLFLPANGNYYMQVNGRLNGDNVNYYVDFGTDHNISNANKTITSLSNGGAIDAADTLVNANGIMWDWNATLGYSVPKGISDLNTSDKKTTVNFDLSSLDSGVAILEGNITVPSGFTPGEIKDSTGAWQGSRTVRIEAIDANATGWYSTEISKTANANGTYPYKLRLKAGAGNFIVRLSKQENTPTSWIYEEMYLNLGTNNDVEGVNSAAKSGNNDVLIASNNVLWKDNGNGVWVPDVSKTGYLSFTSAMTKHENIDLTLYGQNVYEVNGTITLPSTINLSDANTRANINLIDATNGNWVGGSQIDKTGAYKLKIGDTLNGTNGTNGTYIVQVNIDKTSTTNPADNTYSSYYVDYNATTGVSTIKDQSEVRWVEKAGTESSYNAMVPNVSPLVIQNGTLKNTFNINMTSIATNRYTVQGRIVGVPKGAKWGWANLNSPATMTGQGESLICVDGTNDANCSFVFKDMKGDASKKYSLQFSFTTGEGSNQRYYNLFLKDTNDSLNLTPSQSKTVDGSDVVWHQQSGSYWAPDDNSSLTSDGVTYFTVTADRSITLAAPSTQAYDMNFTATGLAGYEGKNVSINLFVPGKPIGYWQQGTVANDGTAKFNFAAIKPADYYMSLYVDSFGELWFDQNSSVMKKGVTWAAYKNNALVDTSTLSSWDGVAWKPSNIGDINMSSNKALTASVPSMPKVKANFRLGSDAANGKIWVSIWQNNGINNAWGEYTADASGDVNTSLNVLADNGYRLEFWSEKLGSGYVYDKGDDNATGGSGANADKLINNQNSWSNNPWGPKGTTLFNVTSDTDLGTVSLDGNMKTITFNITGLDTATDANNSCGSSVCISENIYVSLEGTSSEGWYGKGNSELNQTANRTDFSSSFKMKVPSGTYKVYVYPSTHKGGNASDGDTISAENITSFSKFDWSSTEQDNIDATADRAITIVLPTVIRYEVNGTVVANELTDKKGSVSFYTSSGGGRWGSAEVNSSGAFSVKLESATDYQVNYWSWTQPVSISQTASITAAQSNFVLQRPTQILDINGTITGGDVNTMAMLVDVTNSGGSWTMVNMVALSTINTIANSYSFMKLSPLPTGHSYAVIAAEKTRNTNTGETGFSYEKANAVGGYAPTAPHVDTNASIAISATQTQYTAN